MANPSPARILVVDDEEAILETMVFTFQDNYDVYTSRDARRGRALTAGLTLALTGPPHLL